MSDEPHSVFERLTGAHAEDALVRYVITECHKGRDMADVLQDPYIRNRATESDLRRLVDHHELVAAVGEDAVQALRAHISALGS